MHHAIFGSYLAIENYVVPSTDPYLRRADFDDSDSIGEDDINAYTMDISSHSRDKRAGTSHGEK